MGWAADGRPAAGAGSPCPSADGQEITDNKTGLIWKRCAEGMVLKVKTCTGQAVFFNQPDAAARAKASASPGAEWRLPALKEMSSIVSAREAEEGKASIDPVVFPATPVARFWTASSTGPGYFTFVGFTDGSAGESPRATPGAVRCGWCAPPNSRAGPAEIGRAKLPGYLSLLFGSDL